MDTSEKEHDVLVKVMAYGHFKTICGFESKELEVPRDCSVAIEFIKTWLKANYEINPHEVLLLFNNSCGISSKNEQRDVNDGDVFLLLPLISGG
jgi:molybdopterin converting factor small subunit